MQTNKYILSIAGFDPSSGAGITSDIKTFEAHGLYGLSVCTAITVQNDCYFEQCQWLDTPLILLQISRLFKRFDIPVVKIGIVPSWDVLLTIILKLKALNPKIKIIFDPIITASTGFNFHESENQNVLNKILQHCFVITPNYEEIKQLFPNLDIEETISHMSSLTNIHLKGGHRLDKKGWDTLIYNNIECKDLPPLSSEIYDKHGSGCVLSSALACNIRLNKDLEIAAENAKKYTETFLNSNQSLLGNHHHAIFKQ